MTATTVNALLYSLLHPKLHDFGTLNNLSVTFKANSTNKLVRLNK
jgi:hypothetical protein